MHMSRYAARTIWYIILSGLTGLSVHSPSEGPESYGKDDRWQSAGETRTSYKRSVIMMCTYCSGIVETRREERSGSHHTTHTLKERRLTHALKGRWGEIKTSIVAGFVSRKDYWSVTEDGWSERGGKEEGGRRGRRREEGREEGHLVV